MHSFLDRLAENLYSTYDGDVSRLCVVFPNRRAGLFFRQSLSKLINRPIWMPSVYALEDFVIMKSGLVIPDQVTLLVKLYEVMRSMEKVRIKPFADFIAWGNMILMDFDETDQYIADGNKVFHYLDQLKALDLWNPDGKPLTDMEKEYLEFFRSLADTYCQFRSSLLSTGEAYFGLAFSELIRNIEKEDFSKWDKIIFAGFNALSLAEDRLITYLVSTGKGMTFWDADEYYIRDERQEAGRFLRRYFREKKFGDFQWMDNNLGKGARKISVRGVPGNIGMAKVTGQIIQDIIKEVDPSSIAVVLVDEGLLMPVLNSLPGEVQHFNVTMGFPLKLTSYASFFEALFRLLINSGKYARKSFSADGLESKIPRFHLRDIDRLMNNPCVKRQKKASDVLNKKDTTKKIKIYFNHQDFSQLILEEMPEFARALSGLPVDPADLPGIIDLMITTVSYFRAEQEAGLKSQEVASPELEYLWHFNQLFMQLHKLVSETDLIRDPEVLFEIYHSLLTVIRLPFYGEPLRGLQLMGMLETRVLDFSHIILLSANEGLLPGGKHQKTFIPDEVRKEFALPRYYEKNAVFAYHFYRLLQRSQSVICLYSTEGNELGGGEKSRFLTQILHELRGYNPEIEIDEQVVSVAPSKNSETKINIHTDDNILLKLHQLAEKGFSPTALSTYLACSLQFYFSQVLGIGEKEETEETVDAATLGNVIHNVLENVYRPYLGKRIGREDLKKMLPFAISSVKEEFKKIYAPEELESGKNLIILKIAEGMIRRFILAEESFLATLPDGSQYIELLYVEQWLNRELDILQVATGELIKVKLHGKADRIDIADGTIRIIDYKTGQVKPADLKLEEIALLTEHENPSKVLQLLMYAWLCSDNPSLQTGQFQFTSGIISLRFSSKYLMSVKIGDSENLESSELEEFEKILTGILTEIFDPAISFTQTTNPDVCEYCPFKVICNRISL